MDGTTRVSIRRLELACEVPRDHPSPERVRERIADAAEGSLREALGFVLRPLDARHSDEVLLIRKMNISLDVDLSRNRDEIALRLAARIADQIAAALDDAPGAASSVLRFPGEAERMARFLGDLTAGGAWERWYHKRYEGLKALPVPAALRTAILEVPARGLRALRVLDRGEMAAVVRALGELEACRIVREVEGSGDASAVAHAEEAIVRAIPTWRAVGVTETPWKTGLALLALAAAELDPPALAAAAALAAAVASRALAATPAGGADPMPTHGAAALTEHPSEQPLLALASEARARILDALGARSSSDTALSTRFGGLVLLLPHLARLPLAAAWLDPADQALARMLVLVRCVGPSDGGAVFADPVLRRLCGVPAEGAPDPAAWLEATAGVVECFTHALMSSGIEHAESIALTPARHSGRPLLVAVARPANTWALLAPLAGATREALRSRAPARALPSLCAAADEAQVAIAPDLTVAVARNVTRALAQLAAPPALAGPEATDLAFTLAAQQVMRGFARRIAGFADSSPSYIFRGFLACDALVDLDGARRTCLLGRAPLSSLLHLVGITRGTIVLPWLDGSPLELGRSL